MKVEKYNDYGYSKSERMLMVRFSQKIELMVHWTNF